jgi:RNA polymerase sigma-70 factor (ECF subfamily)
MTDSSRFEAFVRRHQDMVYATALRLLGNRAEAEDIAQTVFLRALQRFEQIGGSESAAGWLKTVTRNACLNHLTRYRSRWRLFSEMGRDPDTVGDQNGDSRLHQSCGAQLEDVVAPGSVIDDLQRTEDRQQLAAALHDLPPHQRVPLVLYHFEDMSYQEIATALHISVAKLKTDMHRARLALRKYLGIPHGRS